MASQMSTESLLNSFPMFGRPGIGALEWAFEETRKRNTSATSDSLWRKSTASTQDENTASPTTAGTEPTGSDLLPPVHFIDEFGCQQRRKGTFLNHTPRDFEMRSSKTFEISRPSRASQENYSRPRPSYRTSSINNGHVSTSPHAYSPADTHTVETRPTIDSGVPAELEASEVMPSTSPEVYKLSSGPHRRSSSVPVSRILTYKPSPGISTSPARHEVSVRSVSSPSNRPQDKKRQRRQTPFKVAIPSLTNAARHEPLEPLVAKHRRKASHDTINDMLPQIETDQVGEMGTFGVIQRYFDSQTGGPVSAPTPLCHTCSPSQPPDIPHAKSSRLALSGTTMRESFATHPIDGLMPPDEPPPAVPDRSPKRLTNPKFPLHIETTKSVGNKFTFTAKEEYSPYGKDDIQDDDLDIPKRRGIKHAGSAQVGRLAPPILSHDALTASANLCLNDLNYYLKHTGPSTESATRPRKKKSMKLFKGKPKHSLAARVGSVEGSPQRALKQTHVPTCARQMTTSGGARHLKIVIPTESPRNTVAVSSPISQAKAQRHSGHVSIKFTEEMLNPLASPEVERILSGFDAPARSCSTPVPVSPRCPKRSSQSPKTVPVDNHPLACVEERKSREEQTRARKLRDLQRIRRKPLPHYDAKKEQNPDATNGALPTPAQTPEPLLDSLLELDSGHDENLEEESTISKMTRMQERVVFLQKQNTALTEALAKIVGLELEGEDMKSQDVLEAFGQVRFSKE